MNSVREHYNYFNKDVEYRIEAIKTQINSLSKRNNSIAWDLNNMRNRWYFEFGIRKTKLTSITMADLEPHKDSSDELLLRLKGYLMNKEVIARKREILKEVKESAITYNMFKEVMQEFFKEIKRMVIEDGFIFHMPYDLYVMVVSHSDKRSSAIDMHTSMKNRQEIIDRGGKVYHKTDCPEGEKFITKYKTLGYILHFLKPMKFPNRAGYGAKVVKGANSLPRALYGHAREIGEEAAKELYINANNIKGYVFSQPEEDYIRF